MDLVVEVVELADGVDEWVEIPVEFEFEEELVSVDVVEFEKKFDSIRDFFFLRLDLDFVHFFLHFFFLFRLKMLNVLQ